MELQRDSDTGGQVSCMIVLVFHDIEITQALNYLILEPKNESDF